MAQFKPHFYVVGKSFSRWQEILSFEINEEFKSGEVLTEHQYFKRLNGIRPRLMYMITDAGDGTPQIVLTSDEWSVCPPMWYAYLIRENGLPPNISVMAFTTEHFSPGSLVYITEAALSGVKPVEQAGAIQWGYGDPKIHQIFVHPSWRRRRIAGALIAAADLINLSGRFSPEQLLYGGDVTTNGGEHLRDAWGQSPRVMQRQGSVIVPPVGIEPTANIL